MVDRPSPQDGPAPRPGDEGVRPYTYRRTDPAPGAVAPPADKAAEVVDEPDDDPAAKHHARVAALLSEFCPHLSPALVDSYVYEALHPDNLPTVEELHPDARWAAMREAMPEPNVDYARGPTYADRREAALADALPRQGDYPGTENTTSHALTNGG